MLGKLRYCVYSLVAFCAMALCGVPAFAEFTAETPSITALVSTTGLQTSLIEQAATWIVIGLAVALSIALVYVGYRLLRRFLGR